MIFTPGDLISADYVDMHGTKTTGLFVIIYNEALDTDVETRLNLTCLKVTSNVKYYDKYCFTLSQRFYGLSTVSIVRANKIFTIKTSSVNKFYISLSERDFHHVSKKLSEYFEQVIKQFNFGGYRR